MSKEEDMVDGRQDLAGGSSEVREEKEVNEGAGGGVEDENGQVTQGVEKERRPAEYVKEFYAEQRFCCQSFTDEPHGLDCSLSIYYRRPLPDKDYTVVSIKSPETADETNKAITTYLAQLDANQKRERLEQLKAWASAYAESLDRHTADSENPLGAAIAMVVGTASMCWIEKPQIPVWGQRTQRVFDEAQANHLVRILQAWIEQNR